MNEATGPARSPPCAFCAKQREVLDTLGQGVIALYQTKRGAELADLVRTAFRVGGNVERGLRECEARHKEVAARAR